MTVCVYIVASEKWNESGFRPPLCTYRLNWARRTSWRWWDDWDDTVLQTQDLKFEPWRSEAEHATSRSRRLPTILNFTRGCGRNIFVSFKPPRIVASELNDPIWHSLEWQIGSFSSEATICYVTDMKNIIASSDLVQGL